MTTRPAALLAQLGLSDSEIAVYLAMLAGTRSARELVKATGQKRPTVYYALGCLERRGLIAKTGRAGAQQFAVMPAEHLLALAQEQVTQAKELAASLEQAIPALTAADAAESRPAVTFFEGKEAVSRAVMDVLYAKSGAIDVVAPSNNFFWQIGERFVEKFVTERHARGIRTRSLWEAAVSKDVIKKYYAGSEVRIVPPVMRGKFATTVFLYDNCVLYVSSLKQGYAVLITSQEHHDTMRAWFDALWLTSKPHGKR